MRAPPTAPSQTVIKPPRICPEITRPGLHYVQPVMAEEEARALAPRDAQVLAAWNEGAAKGSPHCEWYLGRLFASGVGGHLIPR